MADLDLDTVVDRLVIRGDPLTEPEVSESWMKVRAVGLVVASALPGIAISGIYPLVGWFLTLLIASISMDVITSRINDRIEQIEEQPAR